MNATTGQAGRPYLPRPVYVGGNPTGFFLAFFGAFFFAAFFFVFFAISLSFHPPA